jgi:hypothetical protein
MPIFHRLYGLLVSVGYWLQLLKGHGQAFFIPPDDHEHFVFTFPLISHAHDVYFVLDLQWRDGALCDAGRGKWKLELAFLIIVPTHCSLLRIICINDDLHYDAFLTLFVTLDPSFHNAS